MLLSSTTTGLKRQAPGVARNMQLARKAGKAHEIDLSALPEVLPGDLWELGNHRLLCGDSGQRDVVDNLMHGDIADMVVTDPPYAVNYTGSKLKRKAIKNDNLSGEAFRRFLNAAFTVLPLKSGGCFYIWAPSGRNVMSFFLAAEEAGLDVKQTLVWVKNHFVLGRSDYQPRFELIIYGWKPGAPHFYSGGRKQHTVWECPKPQRSPLHPTTKPVALMERAILNNSLPGELVFDGFSGSGSTLIACESTDRRCRAIEIEPHYCGVIIARWEAVTGKRAKLIRRVPETTAFAISTETR